MDCPQCHQPLREGAQFCTRCGARTTHGRAAFDETAPTIEHAAAGSQPTLAVGDSLVGRVLDGKYEIVAPLGAGGMGMVYRARRVLIGDEVAVKVLHAKFVNDETLVERFRREARAAAQLHHPNVVTIHDYGEARGADGFAYIVMELVRGESLRDLLRREGRLEFRRAISLMRDVCAGVAAAHRRQIVHRDIKPDNIIVTPADEDSPSERVKVVDFGIAKLRDMASEGTLTEVGALVGTLFYMSPEQCKGEPLDARADVYSLGAMLYEVLAGAPPFNAQSLPGLILKHVNEPPPPLPADLRVPPALRSAITRALAKDPDERQRDASEFARDIQAALLPAATTTTEARQSAEPFFPATARPEPVTLTPPVTPTRAPTSSAPLPDSTVAARPSAETHPQTFAPQTHAPQQSHAHNAPPPSHNAPPQRRTRATLVVVALCVSLIGLAALAAAGGYFLLGRAGKHGASVNVNVRPSPAPTIANTNANVSVANSNASPSPTVAVNDAQQRAEQKILAGSLLSGADLSGLTPAQLRLLRNTVYARYGRVFQGSDLQQYFQSRPWYRPRTDYTDRLLTTNDRANADLIKAFEDNGGSSPTPDATQVSKEVGDALEAWADTTRERDLDAHMSSYADTIETFYKSQNVPSAQVRADRARAFERYDDMDVKLSNVHVEPDPTGARATATFDKTWKFDSDDKTSTGSVRQQLTLVKVGGRWLINGERDLQGYYTNSEEN
jgi:serine/threonine-protein kinase